jgi:DHA2 family multidrug resistance protein
MQTSNADRTIATGSSETNSTEPPHAEAAVPLKSWLAVVGSALGAFMAVLDIQITSSSLRDIQGTLGASVEEGSWISSSYLIAEIVTIPLTGWLSQVFSTRLYVIVNTILFVIFSMLCGTAHDLPSMILFRAAQGFTGGTLIPMSFSIILSMLPPSKRPVGLAMFSVTAVFAPSIGPAVGGFLTENFGWQSAFYLNLIPGAIMLALLAYSLPKVPMRLDLLKKNDIPGIIFMALGLGSLTFTLEEGQRKDWLGSEIIQTTTALAITFLTLFLLRELRAKNPLVNLRLLARRNFGIGSFANTALGMALYGAVYLLPLYLGMVQGYNAWQIGQVMIWSGLPQLLIIPLVPKLMGKIDPRIMLSAGLMLFGISCLMNSFMDHNYASDQFIASCIMRALGQPLIMIPLSMLATAGIEKEHTGSASALFNMMRNLGGSIGIAIASTLLIQREQFHSHRLGEHLTATNLNLQQWLSTTAQNLQQRGLSLDSANQQSLQMLSENIRTEAYILAFNDVFLVLGIILFIAAGTSLFLKKPAGPGAEGAH